MGFEEKVYLFNKDGVLLWSYDVGASVHSVAMSSDGKYIVAGADWAGSDYTIFLFNRGDNVPLWTRDTGDGIESVAISPAGDYIIAQQFGPIGSGYPVYSFSRVSNAPTWIYKIGAGLTKLSAVGNTSRSVAISQNNYIVAGSWVGDESVYFFHYDSPHPRWKYKTGGSINSVALSSDGSYILAGSYDNKVYVFGHDGNILWSYDTGGEIRSVAISSDGDHIVAGGDKLYLFNRADNTPTWTYEITQADETKFPMVEFSTLIVIIGLLIGCIVIGAIIRKKRKSVEFEWGPAGVRKKVPNFCGII